MIRGTTPTLTFTLPFAATGATKLSVAFSQEGRVVLEKGLSDVTIDGKKIKVTLTESETLGFSSKPRKKICRGLEDSDDGDIEMQIRMELDGEKMASNIMRTKVDKILKEGTL